MAVCLRGRWTGREEVPLQGHTLQASHPRPNGGASRHRCLSTTRSRGLVGYFSSTMQSGRVQETREASHGKPCMDAWALRALQHEWPAMSARTPRHMLTQVDTHVNSTEGHLPTPAHVVNPWVRQQGESMKELPFRCVAGGCRQRQELYACKGVSTNSTCAGRHLHSSECVQDPLR